MRVFLLSLWATVILWSCSKDNDDNNNGPTPGPSEPGIPPAEMVNTKIVGYITDMEDDVVSGLVGLNNVYTPQTYHFETEKMATDKYITTASLNTSQDVNIYKTFPVTPAPINYVRIKAIKLHGIGSFVNQDGANLSYENKFSINFPSNAIYRVPYFVYPGYVGPEIVTHVLAGYLDPLSGDFGASIPCYSMADDKDKRWFLSSFGVLTLQGNARLALSDQSENDFYHKAGTLKLAIPEKLLPIAPDSILLWRLKDGRWIKDGGAKKINNEYVASISKLSTYNFAIPVKGVYKTIRLKTENGAGIVNATVRVKVKGAVVAESQTDFEGNAIVFVPAEQDLVIELSKSWSNENTVLTKTVSATSSSDITIELSSQAPYLFTFKGTANLCNGKPIENGLVSLKNPFLGFSYHFPVKNGQYHAGLIEGYSGRFIFLAKLSDNASGETGVDTAANGDGAVTNIYNLNTCIPSPELYMHFSVDNTSYSIEGDISRPYDPPLNALTDWSTTLISTANDAGVALQFRTEATEAGNFTGSGIDFLSVNGKYYYYDVNKPMRVTFTRYDLVNGGYIIGSADFYYKDENNVSRHLTASFRLRRG